MSTHTQLLPEKNLSDNIPYWFNGVITPLTVQLFQSGFPVSFEKRIISCPICLFYTFCRPNEKDPKFNVSLQPTRFTIFSLTIFLFEKFLTDKTYLGHYLSIYNNTPIYNQNLNSKNLSSKLYSTTVPGF